MQPRARRLATAVAFATVIALALLGGTAYAAWSTAGSGTGAVRAQSLLDPAVSVTAVTSDSATIQWTPTPITGVSYDVTRNGAPVSGCGAASCTESGLAAGTTYTYAVTTRIGTSWQKSSTVQATTTAALRATTVTLASDRNPARSNAVVTLTATVAPQSGTGAPTGTVTFKDNGVAITCTGGSQTLNAGVATCQTSFGTFGAHPLTAVYAGDSAFAGATSAALGQRVVNAAVTGLAFANVTVGGNPATPTCSGIGTGSVTCSVTGGNNARLATDLRFVSSSGAATVYASDASTPLAWDAASKGNTASGTINVAAGASTAGTAAITKNGSNSATITVTFGDGANSFTATLTVN